MRIIRTVASRSTLVPMLKRATKLALAALLGATVIAASHVPPARSQAVELVRVDVQTVGKGYRASKLRGTTDLNYNKEKIGSIDDLIVGKDQILFAVLQVGGFLGVLHDGDRVRAAGDRWKAARSCALGHLLRRGSGRSGILASCAGSGDHRVLPPVR